MTACAKTRDFLLSGTAGDFEAVLTLYDQALRLKAEAKSKKPENMINLDKWYQNELPKKIKSRGKDPHLTHEDMVQTIKWKLARGKFRPNLVNLVQMNTPRVVIQETKKAFRKIYKFHDLNAAVCALCNLKGVGPAMASAILAAGYPEVAPFMADECLLAMPDSDGLDYTMKEYMKLVEEVNKTVERLNAQGGSWTPHKVEMAVWTYYNANDLKPELIVDIRSSNGKAAAAPVAPVAEESDKSEDTPAVANGDSNGASSTTSSSVDAAAAAANGGEDSNLSTASSEADSNTNPSTTNGNSNGSSASADSSSETVAPSAVPAVTPAPVPVAVEAADDNATSEVMTEVAAEATSEQKENGEKPKEAAEEPKEAAEEPHTNGTSHKAPEVASAVPAAVAAEAEGTDTNDSTKENKEDSAAAAATPVESVAVKRPAPEVTAASDAEPAEAPEPAEKKLKTDDSQPQQQQQQPVPTA